MKTLRILAASSALSLAALSLATVWAGDALAQTATDASKAGSTKADPAAAASDMSDGEVRKIDKDNMKITLKHGDIKNLDMPGMTMVFVLKEPAMIDKVKAGDKVKFKAEKINGAFTVTAIQPAP